MSAHTRARRTILWIAAGFLVGVLTTIGLNLGQRVEAISFWGEQEPTPQADGTDTGGASACRGFRTA